MAADDIYQPAADGALRQGEIFSDLVQVIPALEGVGAAEGVAVRYQTHPFAIIVSQDCDLDLDHRVRTGQIDRPDKLVPSVLFCEVTTAEAMCQQVAASDIWKRIRQNDDARYQFLQAVPPELDAAADGLPELTIDFKRFFTLPTAETVFRLTDATPVPGGDAIRVRRRSVLKSPYLEHLCVQVRRLPRQDRSARGT